jgi:hypothetical protein
MSLRDLIIAAIKAWLESLKPKPKPPDPEPPKPDPEPQPQPDPQPDPEPIPLTQIVICDLEMIPDQMRTAIPGIVGSDNQLYYALFSTYGDHEWQDPGAVPDLYARKEEVYAWFNNRVTKDGNTLKNSPNTTALLIANDANDRGGCFMAEPIRRQLVAMGISEDLLTTGDIYYP